MSERWGQFHAPGLPGAARSQPVTQQAAVLMRRLVPAAPSPALLWVAGTG